MRSFLAEPGVKVLLLDERTTLFYAELEADLRKRGQAIPTNDLWIAALTLQHGFHLYSQPAFATFRKSRERNLTVT